MGTGEQIIGTAIENGASVAGIASTQALKSSSSHLIYTEMGNYEGIGTVRDDDTLSKKQLFKWPDSARSVLVIGLSHPEDQPTQKTSRLIYGGSQRLNAAIDAITNRIIQI